MAMLLGTWELGFGYGHIAHLAPLAHALNARGHRLAVAACNPATARAAPGAPFIEVVAAPRYRPQQRLARTTITYGQVIADGGFADRAAAIQLVKLWLHLFDRFAPEAIVAEHAPMSLLAAHVARLPVALLGAGFTVPPATRPPPSLVPWIEVGETERVRADAPADVVVHEVCRAFGAPVLDGLAALIKTAAPFLTTWPELDIHGPRRGATYYGPLSGFVGAARPAWPDLPGPRLFVYLPFEHPRGADVVAALGALGWPTIWHAAKPSPAPLPANIAFSATPVDLGAVLGEAALMVGRASHGIACQAMQHGCPQLVIPETLETALTARQIARYELGIVARTDIRAALESLLADGSVKAAASAAQARYRRYQPEIAAAQLAEAIIAEFAL